MESWSTSRPYQGMQDLRAILAGNVRTARLKQGWSQEELAERAGLDRTYVSGIERQVRNPTITVLARLADGLGCEAADLLRDPAGR